MISPCVKLYLMGENKTISTIQRHWKVANKRRRRDIGGTFSHVGHAFQTDKSILFPLVPFSFRHCALLPRPLSRIHSTRPGFHHALASCQNRVPSSCQSLFKEMTWRRSQGYSNNQDDYQTNSFEYILYSFHSLYSSINYFCSLVYKSPQIRSPDDSGWGAFTLAELMMMAFLCALASITGRLPFSFPVLVGQPRNERELFGIGFSRLVQSRPAVFPSFSYITRFFLFQSSWSVPKGTKA